jgi:Protein of unknown function (DUF2839)
MGDSKRRKEILGSSYGTVGDDVVFLNFTKSQIKKAYDFTISGTWVCISALVLIWVIVRIGVWQHWWGVS